VTSTIIEFIPVFTSEKYFQIIIDSLKYCRENNGIKIFAYVIMDNHFHLLISSDDLSNKIRSLKRHTAREIIKQAERDNKVWLLNQFKFYKKRYKKESNYQVWQEGVHPQLITTTDMAEQKMNYIHYNPVKKGFVKEPQDWIYSSAGNYYYGEGVLEIDRLVEM
jgi:REP element-mobilizing transposase RayT